MSPNGHWLAFSSSESGQDEIYVQPFPGPGGKRVISTAGGSYPVWSRDGRELFFVDVDNDAIMAVDINSEPAFGVGSPRLLFQGRYFTGVNSMSYDVSLDGLRFLMIQPVEPEPPTNQIHVVLNWFEELKRLVATRN